MGSHTRFRESVLLNSSFKRTGSNYYTSWRDCHPMVLDILTYYHVSLQ